MNRSFSNSPRLSKAFRSLIVGAALVAALPLLASDKAPGWVQLAMQEPLPATAKDARAIVLLNERALSILDDGQMVESVRRVVKILSPAGVGQAKLHLWVDAEQKVTAMRGWSVAPDGKVIALKDKDATESSVWGSTNLYIDERYKQLSLPNAEPGSYIAFEYEKKLRPYVRQQDWMFQEGIPVHKVRYILHLPHGWEFNYHFTAWTEIKPTSLSPNDWQWELADVPAVETEPSMPSLDTVTGRMVLSFYSTGAPEPGGHMSTWADVSAWGDSLNSTRRSSSAGMRQKVEALVAGQKTTLDRIRALAHFVQHDIRYFGVEIGIGGYQAHPANSTFALKYGDCKDKATLLATMLEQIGVSSHLLLINTERGIVNQNIPEVAFDHAILAIDLPKDVDAKALPAVVEDEKFGKVLIFDPTDDYTPLGLMHPSEQSNLALIVASKDGHLIRTPLLSPTLNRLERVGHLELTPTGTLRGDVEEKRTGHEAWLMRHRLLDEPPKGRAKIIEEALSGCLGQVTLTSADIENLEKFDEPLVLRFSFQSVGYANPAGELLLVRPHALSTNSSGIGEQRKRKYPVVFDNAPLQRSDDLEINLPAGYVIDELPLASGIQYPFAEYSNAIEAKSHVLHYKSSFTLKDVSVPSEKLDDLRTFMRKVSRNEQAVAVLKKENATKSAGSGAGEKMAQ